MFLLALTNRFRKSTTRLAPLIVSVALAIFCASPVRSDDVIVSGSFAAGAPVLPGGPIASEAYGDRPGHLEANGRAVTGSFRTLRGLTFKIAGSPKSPGIRMWLEDATDSATKLELAVARDSYDRWVQRRWVLPPLWKHRLVRLVVEDKSPVASKSWIGFTLPEAYSIWKLDHLLFSITVIGDIVLEWFVLILPGMAVALFLARKQALSAQRTLTILFAACGITALSCFFAYVVSVPLGNFWAIATLVCSVVILVIYRSRIIPVFRGAVSAVLALWLLSAAMYLSAGLLYHDNSAPGEYIQDRFFNYPLPPDNLLPFILGHAMYNHLQVRPTFFADIQSSDRPPLQTGFVLFQFRFWRSPELQYLVLGVLLQTTWIPALWVLLTTMGIAGPALLSAIAIPALSQFAFVHDLFVWPKLLSAAFGLLALSCFGWFRSRRNTGSHAILCGLLTALAMLSHTGVVMTVIAFACIAVIWHRPPMRWVVPFVLASGVLFLPWTLYQRFYDPPGNALLKLHLAGVIDRNRGLGTLLVENYQKLGLSGWLATKWINIKFLFWSTGAEENFHGLTKFVLRWSGLKFFNIFPALGLANAGFFFRLLKTTKERAVPDRLLLVALASIGVWVLIMFAPESTAVHQGSFVTMILLFSALALYTEGYSRTAALVMIGLQFTEFVAFAVFAKPLIVQGDTRLLDLVPDVGIFLSFVGFLGLLTLWFWKEWRQSGTLSGTFIPET
jgi:hypothetical protein